MHTHVSVTHTPLATVSIFNKFLNLKKYPAPRWGLSLALSTMVFEQPLLSTIQILIDNFKLLVLKRGILRTIHIEFMPVVLYLSLNF